MARWRAVTARVDEAVGFLESLGVPVDRAGLTSFLAGKGDQVTDLALAYACLRGDERAARHFEAAVLPTAARALDRVGTPPTIRDDVISWLRGELFGRERGSIFSGYSGRSPLDGWLRAIVVNEARRRGKQQGRDVTPEAAEELPMPEASLGALRGAHGADFTLALKDAFAALTRAERTLLRQSFLDGLSIDTLAKLYDVHRATVARRIVAAKEQLATGTRARLKERLGIGDSTANGLVTLDNLDESLSHLLRQTRR